MTSVPPNESIPNQTAAIFLDAHGCSMEQNRHDLSHSLPLSHADPVLRVASTSLT